MAQVRKYQGGTGKEGIKKPEEMTVMKVDENGDLTDQLESAVVVADRTPKSTATPEKKYGRFFRGSASLEGQRAYDALFNANRNAGGWGMTNMALKAVEAGHDVYRGSDGSIIIKDASGNDITEQFIPKGVTATVDNGQFWKNLGATFNSKNHRYRVSGEYLDNIDMTPEAAPDNRTELRRGSGWFTTVKDDKGNDIYDVNGVGNLDNEEKIRNIINYALGNEADMDAKYKYSAWSDSDRTKLRGYANEFATHVDENGQNNYADKLIEAWRSGTLTDDQRNILSLMGFNKNGTQAGAGTPDGSGNHTNPFQLEGTDNDVLKSHGITGITKGTDENGNEFWTVEGDDKFKNSTWDLQGFGNAFGKFSGGWIHNGRLYTANEHNTNDALANAVRRYVGNNASNFSDWWNEAKQSGVRFYGDDSESGPFTNFNATQNYDRSTEGLVWDYMRKNGMGDKNVGIREVTNAYAPVKGRRVFSYIDTQNRDSHGVPIQHFFDNNGNTLTKEQLGTELRFPGTAQTDFKLSDVDTSGSKINGMFTHGTYTNPNDGTQMTLMRDANGGYHIYRANPKDGTPMNPIAIDQSRVQEIMDMIHGKTNWAKWADLEKFNKARGTQSTTPTSTKLYTGSRQGILKEGGKIDWNRLEKLQWGGYINNNQKENVTVDNSKASDITKAHAINGSDGGLTEAEKLQVYGALADLGGVAASFAPGAIGGITGGVAGVTGTALKFAGDIKRDGLDWGDVGRGLVNLAFDVAAVPASLLPGGDNVIKASKFVKTIKNIGQPILKWMGTIGCSTALINTATKIINGEKYTSEDLTQLAQGLAGGIVAGKQWGKQIGDAKLAAKLSGKAASKANASFNKNIVINKETNKTISIDDLESIVKNAKGNESAIKTALKDKGASEDITLESLGLNKKKGKFAFFKKDADARYIYEKPTEQKGNSFWHYFNNGSERAQALGADKMFWQKQHANLLGNVSEAEYRAAMGGFKPNDIINAEQYNLTKPARTYDITANGALRRAAMNNPKAFGFEFEGTKDFTLPGQFGARATVRLPKGFTVEKNWKANYDFGQAGVINEGGFGDPFAYEIKPIQIETKKFTTALVPFKSRALTITSPISTAPKFRKSLVTEAHMPSGETIVTSPPIFKAIGPGETSVVPYGQIRYNSANTGNRQFHKFDVNLIPEQNTLLGLEQLGKNAQFKEWANSHPQEARELISGLRRKFTNAKYRHKSTGEKDAYFNKRVNQMKSQFGWRFKEGGLIPMMESGGLAGKAWKPNLGNAANFMDLAQGVASQVALGQAYRHDQNALDQLNKYREQSVHLATPRLDTNDIQQKYNSARNTLRSTVGPNVYADLSLQAANNQAFGQQMVNLDMQQGGEETNRIMQNNAATLDIINQNRTNDVATANSNLNRAAQIQYQKEALKGQKIRDEQANIWQPLSQQFRQQFRDNLNKRQNIKQQLELDALKQKQMMEDKTGIYKDIYAMYNNSGSSKSFNDWLTTNDAAYKQYMDIQNGEDGMKYEANKRKAMYDIYSRYIPYSKNGGSVYKHKTVQEELAVNGDKMSKKAVQKMNDNLIKMLQQLLK